MVGDYWNEQRSQTLLEFPENPVSNLRCGMHPRQGLGPPHPAEFGFPQYNENYSHFQVEPNNQFQTANVNPYQFSLPNLTNISNGFLFSSQSPPNASPMTPSNSVVQFPFTASDYSVMPSNNFHNKFEGSFSESSRVIRGTTCKRKPNTIDLPPFKQLITEEKMAESMSRLHICSDTPVSSSEPEKEKIQRLYMCDEMRKLQAESIIPHQILSKIARPCTALVPWTPPPVVSLDGSRELSNGGNDTNNNNNDEEVDNYTSDSDRSAVEIEVESNPNMDYDL